MRDAIAYQNMLHVAALWRKRAEHYARLYRYIQDRYNQCVCDPLIIAPHMINQ